MDEGRQKHLELIQGVINRLAGNSFTVKGWSVALGSGLFALTAAVQQSQGDERLLYIPLLPVLIFWVLDGFFLWQEKLYRKLYKKVRLQKEKNVDFSMETDEFKTGAERETWIGAVISQTIWPFHLVVIMAVLLAKCLS